MYSEIKSLSEHIKRVQEFCGNLIAEDYNDGKYYYNEILKNNDLPKFIRKNLKYLFKLKIESDINYIKQKDYYNFDDEDSIELFSSLNTFFLDRSFLNSSQLKKVISKIINLHFNYLLRPRFTLLSIFGNEENLEIKLVNNKLANFFEYGDLIEEIKLELLNISFDSEIISKSQFKNLIKEIDEKLILDMNAKEFLDLVLPIFDLFNVIEENTNENLVPTEALMIFFDDKNLTPIVELLENKYNFEQLIYVDKTNFLSLLIEIIDSISPNTENGSALDEVNVDFDLADDFDLSGYKVENNVDAENVDAENEITKDYNEEIEDNNLLENLNNKLYESNDELEDSETEDSSFDESIFEEKEDILNKDLLEDYDLEFSKETDKSENIDVVDFNVVDDVDNVDDDLGSDSVNDLESLEDLLNLEDKDFDNIDENDLDGIDNLEDLDKLIS